MKVGRRETFSQWLMKMTTDRMPISLDSFTLSWLRWQRPEGKSVLKARLFIFIRSEKRKPISHHRNAR